MIQIIDSQQIGYKPYIGEKLFETIENMRNCYCNTYGEGADKKAIIVVCGQEFYVIWSEFPSPKIYGIYDSDDFIETLDFFVGKFNE